MKQIKKLIQKILSWAPARMTLRQINLILLAFGSLNRVTSFIYSLIFFIPFSREQHANIKGKYLYYRNQKKPLVTRAELRRNIHRLEKAMIMRPRRDHFAINYISETVGVYRKAAGQLMHGESPIDHEEVAWAQHVLEEYFATVKEGNTTIDRARSDFDSIPDSVKITGRKVPYASKDRVKSSVSYEDFLALCNRRRSVRWFLDKKVPREIIDDALMAARQSPSACNRLPYEFRVFDDPKLVRKVAGLPFGTAGYSQNIPVVAVVVGKLENYFSSRDRHAIYVDSALAAMPFMLALETKGVSTSVINWPDFEPLEMKMQKMLGLNVSDRPIMLIAIGYADPSGRIPFSQKKELDTIRSYNRTT